jgi:hypothetical protein
VTVGAPRVGEFVGDLRSGGDTAVAKETFLPLYTVAGVMRSLSGIGVSSSVWSPSVDPLAEAAGDGVPNWASWRRSAIFSKTSFSLSSLRFSLSMSLVSFSVLTRWLTRYVCRWSKYICCREYGASRCNSKWQSNRAKAACRI